MGNSKGGDTMKCLDYPYNSEYILKKKKHIKKELLQNSKEYVDAKVAILGGSTTNDIKLVLELFLLNYKIKPVFYESEYNQYWQDAIFPNEELEKFAPDIIYIHTSCRNIMKFPLITDDAQKIDELIESERDKYEQMWNSLRNKYNCSIIQNNFEYPSYRIMGNKEVSDIHGKINFINRLNEMFYCYAQNNSNFYINDINYLSACYGLDKWSDPFYWHMYKYALAVPAIPDLAFNIAKIIKSIYGKNKKGFVLDLDNTLWGGVIGDDGVDNISLGQETPMGQVYSEFQKYLKECTELGIILNVNSKNEYENALAGINHPDSDLRKEDFIIIKANWNNKYQNYIEIAKELNLLPESLVFVDDNPAERAIVEEQLEGVVAPPMDKPEEYIRILDKAGYFEVTNLSKDDLSRNSMYKENVERAELQSQFKTYEEYLISLGMKATIKPFETIYIARIAQLTNKSNQFNLTTRRYTQTEIQKIATDSNYVKLYGKLEDRFGDNGVVSVVIGEVKGKEVFIDLWIMSCRVLKRDMEFAMMDTLVHQCRKRNISKIHGFYYPTAKNGMVKEFYKVQGFILENEDKEGNTEWILDIDDRYSNKNKVINVEE